MSRGGRGKASRGGSSLKAVAVALGINRQEMAQFAEPIIDDPPPLFPKLERLPLPLQQTNELAYMVEVKQELVNRFRESPFYLEYPQSDGDIARYTDKYRAVEKDNWTPGWVGIWKGERGVESADWKRLPGELCWKRKRDEARAESSAKRRKVDGEAEAVRVDQRLARLVEKEQTGVDQQETVKEEEEDEDGEQEINNEEEALSDDDYREEDNDYIHSYFDNGENYGDVGSDDNLDEDAVY